MKQKLKLKQPLLRGVSIAGAWVLLPFIGIVMLLVTTYASSFRFPSDTSFGVSLVVLNGLLGVIVLLLIIIATWKVRKNPFFKHLRIGLWIGVGIYTIILASGMVNYFTVDIASTCTSALKQYTEHSSAVVPIASNLGTGTGFAVRDTSTILTANHVVDGAKSIYANYSSGKVGLRVISVAPEYDLALLQIDKPTSTFFNLSSEYQAGDEVYVYGYPGNALDAGPPSLSAGIISRVIDLASLRANYQNAPDGLEILQTDAAINPGDSGGPLIGKCGVVGVVTAVSDSNKLYDYIGTVSEQNIGYAISSKSASTKFSIDTKPSN